MDIGLHRKSLSLWPVPTGLKLEGARIAAPAADCKESLAGALMTSVMSLRRRPCEVAPKA